MTDVLRAVVPIALAAALGYSALCAAAFIWQRELLYLPGDLEAPDPAALPASLRYWPAPPEPHHPGDPGDPGDDSARRDYRGFVSEPAGGAGAGTVIVFHGNAGAAWQRGFYAAALTRLGLRVILAEYPGYGGRPGSPGEAALVGDALATLRLARRQYGDPLYLWGESLGCAVVAAAVRQAEVAPQGLVLMLPWDSLENVARRHYGFLPVRWLLQDRYDSRANLAGFGGSVAVLIAENDTIIPPAHGDRLFASLDGRKRRWVFAGAGHNSVPVAPALPWWREVIDFVAR